MADRSPDRRPNMSPSRRLSDGGQSPPRLPISLSLEDDQGIESLGVSDGFAPRSSAGHDRPTAPSMSTHAPSGRPLARRSSSLNASPNPLQQRSSTAKVSDQQGGRSAFALSNDAFVNQVPPPRTPTAATTSTVSNDTISTFTISRFQSPFQGPSRPTHPYAMYPQGTGIPSPTLSLSTTSAVRLPERSHVGASGPTHPYAMYPQNTVPEGGSASDPAPGLLIPVGFPGLGQTYQRRLGPEGEEAGDIIGPDGHTEQLPPYSRYPDGIPPECHATGTEGIGPRIPETGPDVPEYDPSRSQVSLDIPHSRLSIRSATSDSSRARLNVVGTAESDATGSLKERLAEKGRRRVCWGKLPLWCIAIVIVVTILLLGGIAGGLLARSHAREQLSALHSAPASTIFSTVTTTLDASPIPTRPPYIPLLPTGAWTVPADVQETSNECLRSLPEANAWSCGPLSNLRNLLIEVKEDNGGGFGMIRLTVPDRARSLEYGAQPPVFSVPVEASMALDINDPERGPAYFFHLMYDKIVILHEADLIPSSSSQDPSRRDIGGDHKRRHDDDGRSVLPFGAIPTNSPYKGGYPGISQKNAVQQGDLVWVCVWNNTLLEGFIYITQEAANSSLTSSTVITTPSASPAMSTQIPSCPYVVKIEERRIPAVPSQPEPYCQMMKVLDDGSLGNWMDSTGGLIIETLDECKPWLFTGSRNEDRSLRRSWLGRRGDDYPTCRCAWTNL